MAIMNTEHQIVPLCLPSVEAIRDNNRDKLSRYEKFAMQVKEIHNKGVNKLKGSTGWGTRPAILCHDSFVGFLYILEDICMLHIPRWRQERRARGSYLENFIPVFEFQLSP